MLTAAALGSLIGVVLALTGAGGGILAIPVLAFGLHLPIQQAGPVGLAAVGLASAIGAAVGLKKGIVRYRAALLIGAAGTVVAPIGVALAQRLPDKPLLVTFALLMYWVAWRMLTNSQQAPTSTEVDPRNQPCKVNTKEGRLVWTSRCARSLAATGALSGLLSGLLGVGGGFVIVPALTHHTDLDMKSVQATSLAVITLVSVSGVSVAVWHGSVQGTIALPFAVGASVAMLATQRVVHHLPERYLKLAFACLCLLVACMMIMKAGAWL